MQKTLLISLIGVAFVLGVGFGYYFTPEYAALKSAPAHNGLGNPDKFLNLRFINGMIAHHMSAIDILENVKKNSNRPELLGLANVVIKLDTEGIAKLYQLKNEMYGDTRKVTKFNAFQLGVKDEKFDLRFLNAMIIHHDEAIMNSKEALTKSYDANILNTANEVINLLSGNKEQLIKWRQDWYNIK
jgi:uncharacterized protein (DUF305 family)